MKMKNKKVKVKTRKSVLKRVKVTGTGKLTHRTNYKGHLRRNKSSKRKRGFKIAKYFTKTRAKKIAQTLGIR
jgi:large subunit ribosomal protein L35